jgi:hypothetical protein
MLSPAQRFFWFGPEKPSLVSFISPSVPRSLLRRRRHGRPLLVPRSPPTSRRLRLRRGPPLLQAIRALSPPPPTPSGAFSSPLPSFDSPSPPTAFRSMCGTIGYPVSWTIHSSSLYFTCFASSGLLYLLTKCDKPHLTRN